MGGLKGPQILEEVIGKEGSDFFQGRGGGGCNFKSDILNDKKGGLQA